MADRKIKALVDTVIKRSTDDSLSLPDSDKFVLVEGEKLEINWYRPAANNHWEFELEVPKNGFYNWFAYIPHVELTGIRGFKNKVKEIAERELQFWAGHKESENGFWQRVVQYWEQGVDITSIDTVEEVSSSGYPWSAVFISWIMKKAGAGTQFKYHPRHSVYIRDAIQKRKNNDINAAFKGYRLDEVSPKIGDLVCASRAADAGRVGYDTTTDYASHCDVVVAVRSQEIDVIGGNVSNSVTKIALKTDTQGKLTDTSRPWFVVIKNLL